jgi:hypothetical protein
MPARNTRSSQQGHIFLGRQIKTDMTMPKQLLNLRRASKANPLKNQRQTEQRKIEGMIKGSKIQEID